MIKQLRQQQKCINIYKVGLFHAQLKPRFQRLRPQYNTQPKNSKPLQTLSHDFMLEQVRRSPVLTWVCLYFRPFALRKVTEPTDGVRENQSEATRRAAGAF